MHAPQHLARIAGLLYLMVGIGGAFANAARAMVAFIAVAAAMMALNLAHQFQALQASDTADMNAFGSAGPDALRLLMLDLHHTGNLRTQVFFGLWLLPMGYLVDTFARLAAPGLGAALRPFVLTPAAVAEVSMISWLLVKGVKAPQRDHPTAVAAA